MFEALKNPRSPPFLIQQEHLWHTWDFETLYLTKRTDSPAIIHVTMAEYPSVYNGGSELENVDCLSSIF